MSRRLELLAAALSAGAAVIHGLLMPEHMEEWWGYGTFFLVAAIAQGAYAVVLFVQPWRRDLGGIPRAISRLLAARSVYVAGILGNAAIVALYVVTRTVGIPFFGPHAGMVEELTPISVLSKVFEVLLILILIRLIRVPILASGPDKATA